MFTKLTSLFTALILTLYTLFPAALGARTETFSDDALKELRSVGDYIDFIQENGAPAMDSATFGRALSGASVLRRILTGQLFSEREETYLDVKMDETLSDMCGRLLRETGFDMEGLVTHVPNALGPIGALKRGIRPDLSVFRHRVFDASDELRQNGQTAFATLLYLFGVYFSVVDHIEIYAVEEGSELVVCMDVTYADGTTETVDPDIVIDLEENKAYARPGYGVAGTGFEVDLNTLTLYTVVNSWQRSFGFGLLYDVMASNPAYVYVTRRYKFSYGGKDWMIQIWKGNYSLVTNGGEVGLYNRAPGSVGTFYHAASDDEMLPMSMEILHGDDLLLRRGPETHWWMTGFRLSKTIYRPSDLTMRFTIEFSDPEMLAAFTKAVDDEVSHDLTYTLEGLTFRGEW